MKYHISFDGEPKRNPYKGKFIALEGIDGCGKSSQIAPLKHYFEKSGHKVTTSKTPRKTEGILAAINSDLMQGTGKIPRPAYQYLFTADYILQMEQIIIPALKRGDVVIGDRYHCWSALAYGLWETNENYDISLAQSFLVGQGLFSPSYQLIVPDVTVFFSISPEVASKRIPQKIEVKEYYENFEVLQKVIQGYEWLLREFPDLFVTIDAERSIDEVSADMIEKIEKSRRESKNKTHR